MLNEHKQLPMLINQESELTTNLPPNTCLMLKLFIILLACQKFRAWNNVDFGQYWPYNADIDRNEQGDGP